MSLGAWRSGYNSQPRQMKSMNFELGIEVYLMSIEKIGSIFAVTNLEHL
jgi:hypothetical protein